jgi:hypothetical protein
VVAIGRDDRHAAERVGELIRRSWIERLNAEEAPV